MESSKGVIEINGVAVSQTLNSVTNIRAKITSGADGCALVYLVNQQHTTVEDVGFEVGFNSGVAMNMNGVALITSTECRVENVEPLVLTGNGGNVGLFGVREFGSCLRNEVRHIRPVVSGSLASWTPTQAVLSSSEMLIDYSGYGAPSASCGVGSKYTNLTGAPGSTYYVNRVAGSTWFAVA